MSWENGKKFIARYFYFAALAWISASSQSEILYHWRKGKGTKGAKSIMDLLSTVPQNAIIMHHRLLVNFRFFWFIIDDHIWAYVYNVVYTPSDCLLLLRLTVAPAAASSTHYISNTGLYSYNVTFRH